MTTSLTPPRPPGNDHAETAESTRPLPGTQSADIEHFLRLLHPSPSSVFEVRIPNAPERRGQSFTATASGFFTDHAAAAKAIRKWETTAQPKGIYVTLNSVHRDLLARAANRVIFKAKHTATDGDAKNRRWIMLDIDSIRKAEISATDAEVHSAIVVAKSVRDYLTDCGWPQPLRGMSGNGAYLLYRVDLPNDDASKLLVSRLLRVLASRFDNERAHIDTAVFNAGRIVKVLGTWARKGDDVKGIDGIENRPHRQSLYIVPDGEIEVVSTDLLTEIACMDDTPSADSPEVRAQLATVDVGGTDEAGIVARCRKYLSTIAPAIDGQGGSNTTLWAAAAGARFGLTEAVFRPLLVEYSSRCEPPWTDHEIDRKIKHAYEKVRAGGDWGKLVRNDRPAVVATVEDTPGAEQEKNEKHFQIVTAAELDAGDYKLDYLILGIICRMQSLIIAGLFKTLKTSLLFDAAISIASATSFLNTFTVPTRRRVMVLTAESGLATVQETCRRICKSRGLTLGQIDGLYFCDRVPRIENPSHLKELKEIAKGEGIEVIACDPAYMMLDGENAGNVFTMGEQLRKFADIAAETDATPILLHHARKNTLNGTDYMPLELGDLAWAGFAEFARQWLLLSRRQRYAEGSGEHRLWMSVGGSAGHNGCWGLDIAEGHPDDEGGRRWEVSTADSEEARQAAAAEAEARREAAKQAKSEKTRNSHREKVLAAFRGQRPAVLTKKDIAVRGGLSGTAADSIVSYMLQIGELAITTTKKANRNYEALELQIEKIADAN